MNKSESRKSNYIKVFVGLIVVLLVLTFLSKSFYNYRLPVVTASLPKQGKLAFSVEGKAELNYAYVDSVYADIDGRLREILVEKGEEVKNGQSLMRFELSGTGEMYDVTASKDGIITWIGVSEGMYVSSMQNTVLYELAEKSEEWACSLIIKEEQLEHINVESVPILDIVNRNQTVEGEIRSIIAYADQNLEGYKVNILIRISDDSMIGERVNITVKEESELFDTLIPVAALGKDTTGYYVMVLRENDSVLGEGYKAHRMSVDLLDSDETYCAVSGLPTDEHVIIAATSEIKDGSDVFYEGDAE